MTFLMALIVRFISFYEKNLLISEINNVTLFVYQPNYHK